MAKAAKATKAAPRPAAASAGAESLYQIYVCMHDIEPEIWRRIVVRPDITLGRLHDILQVLMGWQECHLHQFTDADREQYGPSDAGMDVTSEDKTRLNQLVKKKGDQLLYEYDFGDSWQVGMELEAIVPPQPGVKYPACLEGERAGPPDDSGGAPGYEEMVEILKDPGHEEHGERREWLEDMGLEGFDPEKFDVAAVNKELARLR